MTSANVLGPLPGLYVEDRDPQLLNTTGATLAIGDVCMIGTTVVSTAFEFTSVIDPTTAKLAIGLFLVSLDAPVQNAMGRFRMIGYTSALIAASGVAVGAEMAATNASNALTAVATTQKVIAINQELTTATNQVKRVLFNGWGMGNLA